MKHNKNQIIALFFIFLLCLNDSIAIQLQIQSLKKPFSKKVAREKSRKSKKHHIKRLKFLKEKLEKKIQTKIIDPISLGIYAGLGIASLVSGYYLVNLLIESHLKISENYVTDFKKYQEILNKDSNSMCAFMKRKHVFLNIFKSNSMFEYLFLDKSSEIFPTNNNEEISELMVIVRGMSKQISKMYKGLNFQLFAKTNLLCKNEKQEEVNREIEENIKKIHTDMAKFKEVENKLDGELFKVLDYFFTFIEKKIEYENLSEEKKKDEIDPFANESIHYTEEGKLVMNTKVLDGDDSGLLMKIFKAIIAFWKSFEKKEEKKENENENDKEKKKEGGLKCETIVSNLKLVVKVTGKLAEFFLKETDKEAKKIVEAARLSITEILDQINVWGCEKSKDNNSFSKIFNSINDVVHTILKIMFIFFKKMVSKEIQKLYDSIYDSIKLVPNVVNLVFSKSDFESLDKINAIVDNLYKITSGVIIFTTGAGMIALFPIFIAFQNVKIVNYAFWVDKKAKRDEQIYENSKTTIQLAIENYSRSLIYVKCKQSVSILNFMKKISAPLKRIQEAFKNYFENTESEIKEYIELKKEILEKELKSDKDTSEFNEFIVNNYDSSPFFYNNFFSKANLMSYFKLSEDELLKLKKSYVVGPISDMIIVNNLNEMLGFLKLGYYPIYFSRIEGTSSKIDAKKLMDLPISIVMVCKMCLDSIYISNIGIHPAKSSKKAKELLESFASSSSNQHANIYKKVQALYLDDRIILAETIFIKSSSKHPIDFEAVEDISLISPAKDTIEFNKSKYTKNPNGILELKNIERTKYLKGSTKSLNWDLDSISMKDNGDGIPFTIGPIVDKDNKSVKIVGLLEQLQSILSLVIKKQSENSIEIEKEIFGEANSYINSIQTKSKSQLKIASESEEKGLNSVICNPYTDVSERICYFDDDFRNKDYSFDHTLSIYRKELTCEKFPVENLAPELAKEDAIISNVNEDKILIHVKYIIYGTTKFGSTKRFIKNYKITFDEKYDNHELHLSVYGWRTFSMGFLYSEVRFPWEIRIFLMKDGIASEAIKAEYIDRTVNFMVSEDVSIKENEKLFYDMNISQGYMVMPCLSSILHEKSEISVVVTTFVKPKASKGFAPLVDFIENDECAHELYIKKFGFLFYRSFALSTLFYRPLNYFPKGLYEEWYTEMSSEYYVNKNVWTNFLKMIKVIESGNYIKSENGKYSVKNILNHMKCKDSNTMFALPFLFRNANENHDNMYLTINEKNNDIEIIENIGETDFPIRNIFWMQFSWFKKDEYSENLKKELEDINIKNTLLYGFTELSHNGKRKIDISKLFNNDDFTATLKIWVQPEVLLKSIEKLYVCKDTKYKMPEDYEKC